MFMHCAADLGPEGKYQTLRRRFGRFVESEGWRRAKARLPLPATAAAVPAAATAVEPGPGGKRGNDTGNAGGGGGGGGAGETQGHGSGVGVEGAAAAPAPMSRVQHAALLVRSVVPIGFVDVGLAAASVLFFSRT
jgi:hypothetical protein